MKNIFLGIFLLNIFFIAPNIAKADDPIQKNEDNLYAYQYGGSYDLKSESITGQVLNATVPFYGLTGDTVLDNAQGGGAHSLYAPNTDLNDTTVSNADKVALLQKLQYGGTDVASYYGKDATGKNGDGSDQIYRINTSTGSVYYFHDASGKDYLMGEATKNGGFVGLKKPVPKEDANVPQNSLDGGTGNGALNLIDKMAGTTVGQTLAEKNALAQAQAQIDAATQQKKDLQSYYNQRKDAGADAAELQSIQNSIDAASKGVADANKNYNLTSANLIKGQQQAVNDQKNKGACSEIYQLVSIYCITTGVSRIANTIFKLVSFITYIVGTLFDYSIELSINSAELFNKLGVIEVTWSFIRDVLNMSFIFILLWTAIQILLFGSGNQYNAKKVLIRVVLVAILMNFSLFAAKFMVDTSNVISLKIYEAMKANTSVANKSASISTRVMNTVGLTTLYDISQVFNDNVVTGGCSDAPSAIITISVMGSIFLLILCLALGLAGILFLIRMVNIVVLFVKSPIWVWGYVLPGSKTITKFKDDWWAELKHVFFFPITYLFWMLLALIIFDKLGSVKTGMGGGSFLSLICNPATGSQAVGNTISLVAIFAIVIIFMMQAIRFAAKNAAGPTSSSIGSKAASSVANRFAGYQTYLTKELAKKAKDTTVSASIGAANVPLRATASTVAGIVGGVKNKDKNGGVWQGFKNEFKDSYRNPSIYMQEAAGNLLAAQAAKRGPGAIGESLATLAKRFDNPKNTDNKTRAEVEAERTKKAVNQENNYLDAVDKTFKIMTQAEWEKANGTGKLDEYQEHIKNIMKKRADAVLGSGIINAADEKDPSKSHFDVMKANALKINKDVVTGEIKSVSFDERAMHDSIGKILKYHTTGAGAAVKKISADRFTTYNDLKAKARLEARAKKIGASSAAAKTKSDTKNVTEGLEKLRAKINSMPNEADLDTSISNKTRYVGSGENEETVRKLNKAILNYKMKKEAGAKGAELEMLQMDIDLAKGAHQEYVGRKKAELDEKESKIAEAAKK